MFRRLKGIFRFSEKRKKDSQLDEYLRMVRCSEVIHEVIPEFPKDFANSALIAIFSELSCLRLIKRYLFVIMWCLILLLLFV